MESHQSKEEGELSDEEENGKNKLGFSELMSNSNFNSNGSDLNLNSDFGKLSRPNAYHKFNKHPHQTLSTHGILPNPRNILPRPTVPHPHMKKEQDRACIVIKNNTNINRNRRESTKDAAEVPLKSPSSKIWDNKKLRYSRDKYKKGNTHQQEDNFQALLQQYKDIQGQPAAVKQEENLNELAATQPLAKKRSLSAFQETALGNQNVKGKQNIEDGGDVDVKEDEFDDELDLLELRRNALASLLAEEREEADTGESENSLQEGIKSNDVSNKPVRRSSPKSSDRSSSREGLSKSQNRSRNKTDVRAQRHSRLLRARTPALRSYKTSSFTSRRPYKIDDRTPRRSSQKSYPSRSSLSSGRLRLTSDGERTAPRRNSSEKRSYLADKNDIQKILSLDDPEEKVARLLAMLDNNLSKESEKRALDVKVSPSKVLDGVDSEPTQDNYEEVEMDIDSDPESTPAAPVNPVEELQFEPDFYNAMQPMYMTIQPTYDGYDPTMGWPIQGPSFSDTAVHGPVTQPQQYLPPAMMSFSDSHIPMVPCNTNIFPDASGPYQYIDQQALQIVPEQMVGLRDILPPPPPPPLPCEPPPNPPLPPSDSPPLPASSPPPLPTESLPPPPPEDNIKLQNQNQFVDNLPGSTFQPSQQYLANLNFNNNNTNSIINGQENRDYSHHENIEENHGYSGHDDSGSRLLKLAGYTPTMISESLNSRNKEVSNLDNSGDFRSHLADDTTGRGSESHPLPSEDVVAEEEDDEEEEEARLRAQVLQSMMKKMKEKQKMLEDASRSESSLSRSQSPSSVPIAKSSKLAVPHKQPYNKINMANLPIHKPVIINLGEDSSEEEEEKSPTAPSGVQKLLGGLDSFLKEARRSSETSGSQSPKKVDSEKVLEVKRRQALMSRVRQEEINLLKQSESITKDQTLLKTLLNQASKYLQNVKISEIKVKQLTEQLAAAEKVANANKDNLEKAKKQARLVKDRLLKKKREYETLQKGLAEAGRELHGAEYKIGTHPPVRKRVVQSASLPLVNPQSESRPVVSKPVGDLKTIDNTSAGQNVSILDNALVPNSQKKEGNTTDANKMSRNMNSILTQKQSLLEMKALLEKQKKLELEQQRKKREQILRAKEEKRLKIMKLRYEIKLGEMKLKHAEIDKQKTENKSLYSEKKQNEHKDLGMSKSILKLEKIELGSDPIDLTDESKENQSKRRRSLLELNPSTKPDLKVKVELIRNKSNEGTDSHFEITIPEGKNLLRILKLQKQRVDEDLKVFSHLSSDSYKVKQEYPALSVKQQQLSCLQAYKAPVKTTTANATPQTSGFVYKSPLLHFKSYRFSPYFRTKACKNLTSRCVANKVLPKIVLCRFDLLGTCNDEKCKGQHQKQYLPSDREILLDVVAYSPAIAGVQKDTPPKKIFKIMGDYVDDLLKQNKGRFTVDQMCLILVNKINEHVKHVPPHTMLYTPRLFRPRQDEKMFTKCEKPTFQQTKDDEAFQFLAPVQSRPEDTVIQSEDQRYFYSPDGGSEVQDLESAVLAMPTDVHLWLKLAHNKLYSVQLSLETCLEEALNVLARGLESNKDNSVLWLEYLKLYARHKEASDFSDLCQMALQYAPSFEIWWKYLHSLVSYKDRNEVCSEIIDYLCSVQTKNNISATISHHLLEVMLYRAHLSIMAGQLQYAKNILQGYFVKSEGKVSCQTNLTVQDRCILWLCYIHVLSWQHLPDALWDSNLSGKIINKDDLVLPWKKPPSGSFTRDQQMALLHEAVIVCITNEESKHVTALREGLILYKNIIHLLQCQNQLEEILSVCRDLLQKDQSLVDIWLIVANLYAENDEVDATIQVFNDSLEVNPLSARVFNIAAQFGMTHNAEFAMTCLDNCPQGYFLHDDNTLPDPLSLYCVLLNQTLPLGYNPPAMKDEVTKDIISQQQADIWLNYCLYLEHRKNYAAVVEMYETALSAMVTGRDTGKIWSGYIGFQYRQLQKSASNVTQQTFEQRRMNYLFHRCIVTMPKKLPLEYWNMEHVLDYRPVNSVIEGYLCYLLPEQQTLTLERIVNMMPTNVSLVLRLCEEYLCQGHDQQVLSLCYPLLCDGTHNSHIWKLATTLAIKQRSYNQIEKLFRRAVQAVPYSVNIWKNFLMYQMTQGSRSREMIQAILQHCNLLGLNMEELLQIIKS